MNLIGDPARLQTGRLYGIISDVIFSRNGQMLAVLVERNASPGGTFAFRHGGGKGRWEPSLSTYELPFESQNQADAAGQEADQQKFESAG
jgi:hypothetical protein